MKEIGEKIKKELTNRELATLMERGFERIEKNTDDKIGGLENRIDGKINNLENRIDEKIDSLARMTQKGFEQVDKRFEQVDKRFEQVDRRFEQVDKRFEQVDEQFINVHAHLSMLSRDVEEIKQNTVYRHEFDDSLARISLLERKSNIVSGK